MATWQVLENPCPALDQGEYPCTLREGHAPASQAGRHVRDKWGCGEIVGPVYWDQVTEFPKCEECGHRAWPHGDQSGTATDGEPCHAAVRGEDGFYDAVCQCAGYRHPESRG